MRERQACRRLWIGSQSEVLRMARRRCTGPGGWRALIVVKHQHLGAASRTLSVSQSMWINASVTGGRSSIGRPRGTCFIRAMRQRGRNVVAIVVVVARWRVHVVCLICRSDTLLRRRCILLRGVVSFPTLRRGGLWGSCTLACCGGCIVAFQMLNRLKQASPITHDDHAHRLVVLHGQ